MPASIWSPISSDLSQVNYTYPDQYAVPVSLQTLLDSCINVKYFGAVGDGTTNDTTAIQRAIDSTYSTKKNVFFPAGVYKITDTLEINTIDNIQLFGAGMNTSVIAPAAMAGDYFYFNTCSLAGIQHLGIVPTGAQSGTSAAVHYRNCHNPITNNFFLFGNAVHGVWFDGGVVQYLGTLSNFEISSLSGHGVYVGGTDLVQGIILSKGEIASCLTGINTDFCNGFLINQVDLISCTKGFTATPGNSKYCSAMLFTQLLADTSTSHGIEFARTGTGTVTDVDLVNCWAASNGGSGMVFAAGCDGILVSGSRVINNDLRGIHITGGTQYTITGNQIGMNSMLTNDTYDGIAVEDTVNRFTITGNLVGGPLGKIGTLAANQQRYGINVIGTTHDDYIVAHNQLMGNVTGKLADAGTGLNKVVGSNV